MSGWMFPSLLPRIADNLWFNVDRPCDEENELTTLEDKHLAWLQSIGNKGSDIVPLGKSEEHQADEEEDEEEDDADVDDESDTNDDDELDTDMVDDRNSPEEVELEANEAFVPPWWV